MRKGFEDSCSGVRTISAECVFRQLIVRDELAFVDVRETHHYAQGHPLFAVSMPLSSLELEAWARVPRLATPIVVFDQDGDLVSQAVRRLSDLGYTEVRVLQGGLEGWRAAGYEVFQDLNSPSKAFGELVEARRHTPTIDAQALHDRIAAGEDVLVLDARRFDEYHTMSIPGSISVPGEELVMRAGSLTTSASTRIVVNCAGRTRGIIGAQSLINAGYAGRVASLRNGTIGWVLGGMKLQHDADRRPEEVGPEALGDAQTRAREVAYRAGVRRIDLETLAWMRVNPARTTYCFDVRSQEEFEAGHASEFRHAPGGQLIQETDIAAPVHGARIVLHDVLRVRADMTAAWLAQMGWDVYVLDEDPPLDQSGGNPRSAPDLPTHSTITPQALQHEASSAGTLVLDLSPSRLRAQGHIPGSAFILRSQLPKALAVVAAAERVVLCCADGVLSAFAARDLEHLTGRPPTVLAGGLAAWRSAGQPVEPGLGRKLSEALDQYHRPFAGVGDGRAAMQAYLDWEYGLESQMSRDGSHGFYVV